MNRLSIVVLFALVLFGCRAAQNPVHVMQEADGSHTALVRDVEKTDAEDQAIQSAQTYCRSLKKETVFLKRDVKYTGTMDEATRREVRRASKVATEVGLPQAGKAGNAYAGDKDYTAEVTFRCN